MHKRSAQHRRCIISQPGHLHLEPCPHALWCAGCVAGWSGVCCPNNDARYLGIRLQAGPFGATLFVSKQGPLEPPPHTGHGQPLLSCSCLQCSRHRLLCGGCSPNTKNRSSHRPLPWVYSNLMPYWPYRWHKAYHAGGTRLSPLKGAARTRTAYSPCPRSSCAETGSAVGCTPPIPASFV